MYVCTFDMFDVYVAVNLFCIDIENGPVFLTYVFFEYNMSTCSQTYPSVAKQTPNDANHGFTWFMHVCTFDTFDVYPVVICFVSISKMAPFF